jgi:hypothetical protein
MKVYKVYINDVRYVIDAYNRRDALRRALRCHNFFFSR